MASTNKTANYELSQFVETDRPAWLTDYNGDMRTIDSTMKAISDVASGASGSISELADRMSTAEGNISTNTNDIDALEARADALEAQAQSTAGTIANIQTEQTAQNLGIEAATELGYNLARPYDSASTYSVGDYVLFQNTLYKCITAVATGEAFDPTKWLAIKATDEISAGGSWNYSKNFASNVGGSGITNPVINWQQAYYNNDLFIFALRISFDSISISASSNAAGPEFDLLLNGNPVTNINNQPIFASTISNIICTGEVRNQGRCVTILTNNNTSPSPVSSVFIQGVIIRHFSD